MTKAKKDSAPFKFIICDHCQCVTKHSRGNLKGFVAYVCVKCYGHISLTTTKHEDG